MDLTIDQYGPGRSHPFWEEESRTNELTCYLPNPFYLERKEKKRKEETSTCKKNGDFSVHLQTHKPSTYRYVPTSLRTYEKEGT